MWWGCASYELFDYLEHNRRRQQRAFPKPKYPNSTTLISTASRWVVIAEKVLPDSSAVKSKQLIRHFCSGGKAKPLKAPKKEKKEMDEDEIAFREKQKAGA